MSSDFSSIQTVDPYNTHRNFRGVYINAQFYLNKDLNWIEKILLIEVDSFCDKYINVYCELPNGYFADVLGVTEKEVEKMIKRLRDENYLQVESSEGTRYLIPKIKIGGF